jgi:hypothetical protein
MAAAFKHGFSQSVLNITLKTSVAFGLLAA